MTGTSLQTTIHVNKVYWDMPVAGNLDCIMVIIRKLCLPTVHQRPLVTNCCSLGAATTCLLRGRSKVFLIYELCRPVQLSDDYLKGLILAKGKISNISVNIKKEIKDGLTN